ncbi:MAG: tetratricopeptide repeat protein [Planctomycetia bacterium]|nr:tetratricopeptide repeat protein [Planctomycetia bacterium]
MDIDGDGDLDLVLLSLQGLRVMENVMPRRHFARVRLRATSTEPLALNAMVKLSAGGVTQQEYVRITDGFMTQVPREMHFGLGDAAKVDRIIVRWPGGAVREYLDLPADRLIEISEDDPAPRVSELPRWPSETRPRARPSFSFDTAWPALAGGEAPLAKKGMPAVINVWSPSCAPCREELPRLASLAKSWAGRVQFAGVSAESKDLAAVRAAVESFGVGYPQFVANDAFLRSFFGGGDAILPSTFVFDADGRLRQVFHRAITDAELAALLGSFSDEGVSAADLESRGSSLITNGEYEAAVEVLRRAVTAGPRSATACHALGVALAALAESVEAGAAPTQDPAEVARRRNAALPHREESIAVLRRAVELDPEFAMAQYNLGVALQRAGRHEAAIEALQASIRISPGSYDALYTLGMAAGAVKQNALAADCFDKAIAIAPRRAEAWVGKGLLLRQIGRVADARAAFEKALEVDPGNEEAKVLIEGLK